MDLNDFRGLWTVASLVAFIGIWIWAFSNKRKRSFDHAANSVLSESEEQLHQRTLREMES